MLNNDKFLIGVCGGSASGKTLVCESLLDTLDDSTKSKSKILSMDCFYRPLTPAQQEQARNSKYDFDHPEALDLDRFEDTVLKIKKGDTVSIPDYDFVTHKLSDTSFQVFKGSNIRVLFVEGIHVFQRPELFDLKIFVDVDSDERLARRILRDTKYRGRTHEGSIAEWRNFVKPNYDNIIFPTKRFADVIIPRGGGNTIAFNMVSSYINNYLTKKI